MHGDTWSGAILALRRATFEFRTREDAVPIAQLAATLTRRPELTELGIMELMINAVEHGNLGITSEEKSRLLREGTFEDELAHRHTTAPYRDRVASMLLEVSPTSIVITITDDGDGFVWSTLDAPATKHNGRGLALARSVASQLTFNARGNSVTASFIL